MKKIAVLLLLVACIAFVTNGFNTVPPTVVRHPVLTIQAMQAVPIGSKVVPYFDGDPWCKTYHWGCGHPATVVEYRVVADYFGRPLLVYRIHTDGPMPLLVDVDPGWVVKLGQ
jgi:hypothetical protein